MPSEDGAVTSTDVKKTATKTKRAKTVEKDAEEIISGESTPVEVDETDTIESLKELAQREASNIAKSRAGKVLDKEGEEKFLLKMERANASWATRDGVVFSKAHPYQLVSEVELTELLNEGGFRRADPQEVVNFYKNS